MTTTPERGERLVAAGYQALVPSMRGCAGSVFRDADTCAAAR